MNQDPVPNPYASRPIPTASLTAEETRHKYFAFESSVRSVGIVFFLASLIGILGGIALAGNAIESLNSRKPATDYGSIKLLFGIGSIAIGINWFIIGERLRSLSVKARMPAILFSFLGLLAVPLGTIASIYLLHLLNGERGSFVFSNEYKTIQSATPTFKYQQSGLDWFRAFVILSLYAIGVGIWASVAAALLLQP